MASKLTSLAAVLLLVMALTQHSLCVLALPVPPRGLESKLQTGTIQASPFPPVQHPVRGLPNPADMGKEAERKGREAEQGAKEAERKAKEEANKAKQGAQNAPGDLGATAKGKIEDGMEKQARKMFDKWVQDFLEKSLPSFIFGSLAIVLSIFGLYRYIAHQTKRGKMERSCFRSCCACFPWTRWDTKAAARLETEALEGTT